MRIIGLAGWSGSGKTTLIAKVIPCLIARGLHVSTLKHAHHGFDLDQPGKDSLHPPRGRRHRGDDRLGQALGADARVARRSRSADLPELLGQAGAGRSGDRSKASSAIAPSQARGSSRRQRQAAAASGRRLHRRGRLPTAPLPAAPSCRWSISTTSRRSPTCCWSNTLRRSSRAGARESPDGAAHRRLLRVFRPAAADRRDGAADRASAWRRSPKPRRVPLRGALGRVIARDIDGAGRPAAVRQFGGRWLRGAPRRSRRATARRGLPSPAASPPAAPPRLALSAGRGDPHFHRRADAGRRRHGVHAGGRAASRATA